MEQENKKVVYAVRQEWATDGEFDSQINLFDTQEKAQEFFKECVTMEKTEFMTSKHLDEDGEIEEGYYLCETEGYYEFYDGNYGKEEYSTIWIEELEVK